MNNIIPSLKYLWITIKHKWFVLIAGIKIGCPIYRLITHDLSKFSFKEFPYYGNFFFGNKTKEEKFKRAWVHHQNSNDHHWEYWIPRTSHDKLKGDDNKPITMDKNAILEMIADWIGASRAYEGKWPKLENWWWYKNRFNDIVVNKYTYDNISMLLNMYHIKEII